jgi:SAM-dependent methyltransferase
MGTDTAEDEQKRLWNGSAGQTWVEEQELLDGVLAPFERLLTEGIPPSAVLRVLDVGCGTGGTTRAVARRLGPGSHCMGVDISEPMIGAARGCAEREGVAASFVCADAQSYAFEPGSFDLVISRFGVMFFGDPPRAFANLRRAAMDGATLRAVVWRGPSENPFMTTAERAAAPLLPSMPRPDPYAPGRFSFADADRVRAILEQGGWGEIEIRPLARACSLPERALLRYVTRLGPLGLVLPQVDEQARRRVVEAVRAAFEPYVHGDQVRFDAACWDVRARAPAAGHGSTRDAGA